MVASRQAAGTVFIGAGFNGKRHMTTGLHNGINVGARRGRGRGAAVSVFIGAGFKGKRHDVVLYYVRRFRYVAQTRVLISEKMLIINGQPVTLPTQVLHVNGY